MPLRRSSLASHPPPENGSVRVQGC
jgi:hypothetical protein